MVKKISDEVRFRALPALEVNPEMSQRQIAEAIGISLGLVNYCLRGLAEKGHVKIRNFRSADNKLRYAYVLTPRGLSAKAVLARGYLRRRVAEYEALEAEITALEEEFRK